MSITLADGSTTLTLNPDLMWSDENNWNPVEQSVERTVTGATVVMSSLRVGGRPITLEPEDDSSAWMVRNAVDALRNWAAVPGKEMTLTLRGVPRTVIFRHQDGGFEARPVIHYNDVVPTDFYLCTIRLMEI
ncbi:hypothetical protein [Acidovorax phage ACPWH]|nr:hypothetical protein [Acidovorax phage ACPWH]QXV72267.1 hypothetical protein Acf1_00070 [Acidovorax phage ACF1]